ncbi:MAG TPA: hypothetical protein VGX03_29790, partial [Candidatus Binatia bacterium]|nr:hypothetical protein [Candidatus Binatia bacterium]
MKSLNCVLLLLLSITLPAQVAPQSKSAKKPSASTADLAEQVRLLRESVAAQQQQIAAQQQQIA